MNRIEAAGAYDAQAAAVAGLVRRYEELQGSAAASVTATEAERLAVALELGATYLPELSADAVRDAVKWTGCQRLQRRDPLRAMEHEDRRLRHDLATIEGSAHYQRRAALVGVGGELVQKLEEAREFLAPWEAECGRFEALEGFLELYDVKYDTPAFAERWWQPSYWRHWAAGDAICAALGLDDFGDDVLPAYEKARTPRDQWRAAVAEAEAAVQAVHALVERRDAIVRRLVDLRAIYLAECRQILAEHLLHVDAASLELWSRGNPPVPETARRELETHLRRLSGLAAKLDTYRQVGEGWAQQQAAALRQTQAQFEAKARKLKANYRKRHLPAVGPTGWDEKVERHHQRLDKADATVQRVRRYDRYDRFELSNDPALWWVLFSDHHAPPVWVPGYRDWYARNPDRQVVLAEADEPVLPAHHHLAATGDVS